MNYLNPKKKSEVSKFRAAVYEKTPKPLLISKPKILTALIILQIISIILFPVWRTYRITWFLLGISIPISGWLFMRWRIYSSVFITPPRTVTKLTDNRWKTFNFKGWGKENLKAQFLESETKSKDVILYLHGYNSTLGRGESRCQHMNSMGLNVLSLDQRGFGEQKGKYEWTILKVVADIELLLAQTPEIIGFKPEKLWIYGHSMGGFLTIRLSSFSSDWWGDSLKGVILESPATSFPLIIEKKLPGRAIMANPWVRHILRREYQRIHPDLNVGYSNAQIPFWGVPKVPILVIQAEQDETLGIEHFNLLKEHFSDISEIHIVSDMPHTSRVDVLKRREILENWINNKK
ncbi:MAG: alpha/beta fold hydrolase [Euryarchaeota archaeon]|nr:alpha/beta fold hydrolase [Euryarchaeota archaeon]MBT4391624.1 alpha/beta fold hydrolase [Euryarchaeota archaeon]MBT4802796.1 alpha/beta fold hydrolase [Euryarchaeota archaeon]MBT5613501.1 alpha/beta fold hydrolase [Euryarchaeota archaeon]MBT6684294.1 alpha/beta fold hydrolase [Euryarchaeota archaeon]